jgi:hypothetical protein
VTWKVAASKLLTATYCRVFCIVYRIAGMPSFQLSLLTIADARVEKSVASVVFEGKVCDISYKAFEQRQSRYDVGT